MRLGQTNGRQTHRRPENQVDALHVAENAVFQVGKQHMI